MSYGDPYYPVESFKARIGKETSGQDQAITDALVAASRIVDGYTGRRFDQTDTATARLFTPVPNLVYPYAAIGYGIDLPDFVSVESVESDAGTYEYQNLWSTDDYALGPSGAVEVGAPYTRLLAIGAYGFSYLRDSLRVTAVWGWPSVPSPIAEATFLIANRLRALWTAPFGQSGGAQFGGITDSNALTPQIQMMIAPYRLMTV